MTAHTEPLRLPVHRAVTRAAQWVLNDPTLSKEPHPHPRNTIGWDPLRPATWRRLAAERHLRGESERKRPR